MYYSNAINLLELMIGMYTPINGPLDPGLIIGRKRQGFGRMPLVTSPRPPIDDRAHLTIGLT
jgi:hypothetical protein